MDEKKVYNGNFITVTEEEIGGSLYERSYIKNSLTIFPVTDDSKIIFIKENRIHERPSVRWKPVTGYIEPEGSVEENANRELQEEIGKKAAVLEPYFEMRLSGTVNTIQQFFIAKQLTDSKIPNPDGEDSILEIASLDMKEILERTLNGEFAKGSVGYGLMKLYYEVEKGIISL